MEWAGYIKNDPTNPLKIQIPKDSGSVFVKCGSTIHTFKTYKSVCVETVKKKFRAKFPLAPGYQFL